ncbi:MAG: 30S ribosomal protein S6 [Planctomycetia bacterium]|nr:30S ribosomal protein S6 [Planctomycetia bacterium]
MKSNVYEGLFLLDTNRYNRDPEGVTGVIPKVIREFGGEVLVSRFWDERRLAYPVEGHRKGTYWLTYFRLPTSAMAEMRSRFQITDSILRVLFVRIDDRIVDQLVAHATGAVLPKAEESPAPVAGRSVETGDDEEDVTVDAIASEDEIPTDE